jgi:hypothetical protein
MLAAALDRRDDAPRHFENATDVHERIGARPFLAWTQLAHARVLLGGNRPDATALITKSIATARELGMDGLLAKVGALGLAPRASAAPANAADRAALFHKEGDFWTVAYAGKAVRVRHGKGLGDIAMLLANPGKEIHVADLIAATVADRSEALPGIAPEALSISRGGAADALLDPRARADYRARLAELHREIEDAERCNDVGRVSRARAELDAIASELASALGLGGRSRRATGPIERARKAIASRIRFSLDHIARVHPTLADHLRRHIRTGTVCTYVVPDDPVRWSI